MTRKVNRGISMFEILMALAIFLLMLIPLIRSLITGMNTTTTAKETQIRNEYAQNLMENVQKIEPSVLDYSVDEDAGTVSISPNTVTYFQNMLDNMGSNNIDSDNITVETINEVEVGGTLQSIVPTECVTYDIYGKTYLGTKDTEYSYAIEITNKDFAIATASGKPNPNQVSTGIVEEFDTSKVAIISAYLGNYDYPAFDALVAKKLENRNEDASLKTTINGYTNKVNRRIHIDISGDATSKYRVECTLTYTDVSTFKEVSYKIYSQDGFASVPSVYLMYNACIYKDSYANDEMITFDLSKLSSAGTDDINVFVIPSTTYREVDDIPRNVSVTLKQGGTDPTNLDRLCIYHDFDQSVNGLTMIDGYNNFRVVTALKNAQSNRGLYKVRLWMQKGDVDLNTLKSKYDSPILQATIGGVEN